MDKYTVLREDIEAMTEAGLTDQEIGVTLLAMVRYGMDGTEPEFDEPGPRIAFAMLKKRMDKYIRKCETNAANGQSGGRPTRTENNPTETQQNPTETQPKPNENPTDPQEYDYDKDQDEGEDGASPSDIDTHTIIQQGDTAGARAKPGWFDPAHPQNGDDGAWKYNEKARKATAQRILTYVLSSGRMKEQFSVTRDGVTDGLSLFDVLCAAMKMGLTPKECLQMADNWQKTWQWEKELREYVISQGGDLYLPEHREELALQAYG